WTLDNEDGDDLQRPRIDNDDLVVHDEVAVAAPRRVDPHERLGHRHEMNAARDYRANADVEVDRAPRNLRRAARLQDRRTDLGLLLGGQRHRGTGLRAGGRSASL